jgi:hypothetical protein
LVELLRRSSRLAEQAEGLHRQFFRPAAVQQAQVVWEPPVDLFENEREIVWWSPCRA